MKRFQRTTCIFFAVFLLVSLPLSISVNGQEPEDLAQTDWSRVYFLGESTTAHLRRRGELLGPYAKSNIFAPDSGTLMLSSRTLSQRIGTPGSNEKISISEAVRQTRPPVLILSFGLNGIVGFHTNENRYLRLYENLIDEIRKASPETQIALQTIYPVAEKQTNWKFAASPKTVNEWIDRLNERLTELANEEGIPLLDTAAHLKDEAGYLHPSFSADGIHMTSAGYDVILRDLAVKLEELQL